MMRLLLIIALVAGVQPAAAADWRGVSKRSKASPAPAELVAAVRALAKLGYRPRPEHKEGWFAWTPGCGCDTFMLCWGLERSYRSQLRLRGHEHDLWGWVYDSEANATLAQENYEWLGRVHHYSLVLERRGGTLVVLEGPGDGPDAAKLRAALGRPLPGRTARSWLPGRLRGASQPAQVRRPVTKEQLLDPATPDTSLPALAAAFTGPDVERILNQRGMRLYRNRLYARAAIAFELAIGDTSTSLPVYNRACVAARQGDPLRAVVWLWRVRRAPHLYGTNGTYDSSDLLRRATTDRDFDAVRRSAAFRAFEKCL